MTVIVRKNAVIFTASFGLHGTAVQKYVRCDDAGQHLIDLRQRLQYVERCVG